MHARVEGLFLDLEEAPLQAQLREEERRYKEAIKQAEKSNKDPVNAREQYERESSAAYISGQSFRAGCEGSISVLKRAFRLLRCPYRGFSSFAASVGLSIFCHNLVVLARPPGK